MTAEWPVSVHPATRNPHQWNALLDMCAAVYRLLEPDERVTGMSVKVINGQGQATVIVRDREGTRRIVVSDEAMEAPEQVA